MAVLITGGLGHVGSWVATHLARAGRKVIICDMAAAHFDRMGLDYLEEVRDNIVLESVDVLDTHTLFETFLRYQDELEGVIHGVSVIAGPTFKTRPFRHLSINAMGTLNVYETCRLLGIKRIVNMSSGAVYGDASGQLHETTPYKATDLYGATKISGELYGDQYSETYDMDIRQARLFFVYGPGKKPSHMHAVYQAMFGPLEGLKGVHAANGRDQITDWTHVEDTAQGIVRLFDTPAVPHRHYNISCGVAVSHQRIVELVSEQLGYDSDMQLGPGPFVVRGAPLDIQRARDDLGFTPRYADIREGLEDYRRWLLGQS
ncbi:UDP-glucose 4-epimerase [Halomonas cupida]|uniref:UDP-glucose 4-epimerase n=1 Tax=Halomonas cupida TaxID=44933 RepID=A0A1M7AX42_9GAMM|nr:NAD(P)-dependent oxidoreductase [Halomonas cupida]GEN22229.1 UDP-glucose 4-epimerase [Halomonas cupida]SHL47176.1 Nucleoside-diphosphate-sugar epimerase [Halomonas cupida]